MAFIDDIQAQTQKAEDVTKAKEAEEFNKILSQVKDAIKSASSRGSHETSFSPKVGYGKYILDNLDDFKEALPGFEFEIQTALPDLGNPSASIYPRVLVISW